MFKKLGLIILCLVFASPAFASFNWGTDTYSTVGNQLIVNSLGDQSTVSTFGSLGTNDWIPENAVKNYLSMEGYTTAIDYNPSITNPQFASAYNQAVPAGYTKLQFAGKLGDPRATQDVYVKTEEYNRLNSEMQAQRILQESIERNDDVDRLGIDINNANYARLNGDNQLQSNIDTVDTNSKDRDSQEVVDRINGDKKVQDKLDSESSTRSNADQNLQNSINKNADSINNLNDRVNQLERTQTIVSGEVRLYDSRKITVSTFTDYNTTRNTVDRTGVKVVYKFGSSYEERRLDQLQARLDKLENAQSEKENLNNTEVYTTANGFGIKEKF